MKKEIQEQIIRAEYSEVMKKSYIDYAMSTIVARALPDVRDGLKPVHRRTLYDMYELGIKYDKPYRKSARIVGDTMGKYHPHGDSSIYESLVVMSQEFKKGLPLVDGHGNFGSIEGDGAAAMRYTEARLEKITQNFFLADLDKNIVDFAPNFDETEREPVVLPVKIPNLLVNGADGIAVGMRTSIPPHHLGEVIDGVKAYIKNPDITTLELMKYIKGPDFPTGGIISNKQALLNIYQTGAGKIKIRGKVEIEQVKTGKQKLVITEIPYTMVGANIGKFLNDVCRLVENKVTNDIMDISNQSSKEGIRIVLDLRKGADVENLKNLLYQKTGLEDTFGVNMLAVVDGRPEILSLNQIIKHHVNFQYELATRKYNTLLAKELDKKEIQEGLIRAYDVIDLIIEILRGSKNKEQAQRCMVEGITDGITFKHKGSKAEAQRLCFTKKQAIAILDMRLYRLIGLEIEALTKEYEETMAKIERYQEILGSRLVMAKVIMHELDECKKEFKRPRRTALEAVQTVAFEEKEVEAQEVVFLMNRFGYGKTIDQNTYERNKEAVDAENKYVITCMNVGKLAIFTDAGQLHVIKVQDVPFGKFRDKGTPIDNLSQFSSADEEIVYVNSMMHIMGEYLLFASSDGMVKRVEGKSFDVSKRATSATKLNADQHVMLIRPVAETDSIVIETAKGYFLRFGMNEVPIKKKPAIGVRGMKVDSQDKIESIHVFGEGDNYKVKHGGKDIAVSRLHMAKRDGKGIKK